MTTETQNMDDPRETATRLSRLRNRLRRRATESALAEKSLWRQGLTLVELAIVLLVLGIIMTVVFTSIDFGITDKAVALKLTKDATFLRLQVEQFERDVRGLDDRESLDVLAKSSEENPAFKPLRDVKAIQDPWTQPYYVQKDPESNMTHICTYGADRIEGGVGKNEDFCITRPENDWPAWIPIRGRQSPAQ